MENNKQKTEDDKTTRPLTSYSRRQQRIRYIFCSTKSTFDMNVHRERERIFFCAVSLFCGLFMVTAVCVGAILYMKGCA